MAKIDFLQDSSNEYIYPITVAEAIYTLNGDTLIEVLNTHVDDINQINRDIRYTSTRPIPVDIGGISAGSKFNDTKLVNVIDELLHPMTSPSITITPNIEPGTYPITADNISSPMDNLDLGSKIDEILTILNIPIFTIERFDIDITSGLYKIKEVNVSINTITRSRTRLNTYDLLSEQIPIDNSMDSNHFAKTITVDNIPYKDAEKVIISVTVTDTFGASHQKDVLFSLVSPILVSKHSGNSTIYNIIQCICVPNDKSMIEINFGEFSNEGIGLLIPKYLGRVSKIIDRGGFDILPIFQQTTYNVENSPFTSEYNFYTTTPITGISHDISNKNFISLSSYSCTIYFDN